MRLGAYPCRLIEGTRVRDIYDTELISERHRHRYEVNINLRGQLESAGLLLRPVAGRRAAEIVELPGHPWFVGVQFHPELKSKPLNRIRCSSISSAPPSSRAGWYNPAGLSRTGLAGGRLMTDAATLNRTVEVGPLSIATRPFVLIAPCALEAGHMRWRPAMRWLN